jgi:hypothetical protein
MEGVERRNPEAKRLEVTRPVAVFAEGREGILRGRTRNISTDGCSINLDDILEIGENVLFRIDLGEGFDPAVQSAQVVWADPGNGTVGVKFTSDKGAAARPPGKAGRRPRSGEKPSALSLPGPGSMVKLSIEKMDKPLRVICQEATSDMFLLRTSIPFLETMKRVTVHFKDEAGEEKRLKGMLTDVSLEKVDGEDIPFINLMISRGDEIKKLASPPPPQPQPFEPDASAEAAAEAAAGDGDVQEPESGQEPEAGPGPGESPEQDPEENGREALEEDTLTDIPQESPLEASAPEIGSEDVDAFEESFRLDPSALEPGAETDKITPRYVIAVQRLASLAAAAGGSLRTSLGPTAKKLLPLLRTLAGRLLQILQAAALWLWTRVRGMKTPGTRPRVSQRKTRMTMRRQVPIHKSMIAGLKSAKWQILLLVVTLLAFSAGVWGLVNLFKTNNNEDLPEPPSASLPQVSGASSGLAGGGGGESYDLWGGGVKPSTVNIEQAAVVEASAPPSLPPPAPAPAESKAPAAADESAVQAGITPPPEAPLEEDEVVKDEPIWVNNAVRLYVKGEIYGFKHYPLKEPPGIVVDVKGAQPRLGEGLKEIAGSKIKHVKTLKREDGTRFILIFNGKSIPPFELIAHSDRIEVKML